MGKWEYFGKRLVEDLGKYVASPRRDLTYWSIVLVSLVLAVLSDFLGVMRWILSLDPATARRYGLDQVYEVEGTKTFRQASQYTLRYPGTWLFDQSVAFSQQAEREVPRPRSRRAVIPDAAFGPPGGGLASAASAENLSVVVQRVGASGTLEEVLGEPQPAFQRLVGDALAPEGSGRTIEVLHLGQRRGLEAATGTVYEFEYILTKPASEQKALLHTWSAVALGEGRAGSRGRPLYTMTIVAPEASLTEERRRVFATCWRSFELLVA